MKRLSALAVIACVVCIWNVGYSAQEQTPDKRLEQKVVVKAVACPLGDFLAELSAKTGVKMTARADIASSEAGLPLAGLSQAQLKILDEWMAGDPNASPEIMPSLKKGIFRILQARQSNWDCSVRDTEGHWMFGSVSAESDSQGSNRAAKQKIIEPTCEISVKSASEP